jgi:glutamine---fructose-6-phosphate transaminase (isomerizing)
MCGIAGYIGNKKASTILTNSIRKLEYRGYDSVGIATINNNQITIKKAKGRVDQVAKEQDFQSANGNMGIAHSRWATHGKPTDYNSHPFTDHTNRFVLVHNGIIENYLELKEELRKQNIPFTSDTDSEVIVQLISNKFNGDLLSTVKQVVQKLTGAYAICVMDKQKEEIIVARNGSPLIIGVGQDENFIASDASAIIEHTKKVIYLEDFQIARVTKKTTKIFNYNLDPIQSTIHTIEWDLEQAQKQGYDHFMLKEIYEQPKVIADSLSINTSIKNDFQRVIFVGCGTASYAGFIGTYLFEKHLQIPARCEIASEFRYKNPVIKTTDLIIAISQSGETADTLAAIRLAKSKGAKTLGIINVVGSTIAREVDQVIYSRAGPEIGVASTKAFISQLMVIYNILNELNKENQIDLTNISKIVTQCLNLNDAIKNLAKKYFLSTNFMYIGRDLNFPLALEGALKLKEISYIHAEGYPAGELKHGPLALICEETPTLAIATNDPSYEKTFSNIQEIKARGGKVISIATIGDTKIDKISDDVLYLPKINSLLNPILTSIPLQLFAYHIANLRECDIDKPRNLAKSVTVE